ncbi:RabGAP/TBC [Epithele typhae]|uniref:RabGAP/TBC n=1 Tax=Epithele typhae TaxID=378194 RepID=UPI00200802B5|nr:RabGAP/TBC [Epithele typhae]KAH9917903.1 RabGAP/TBC [Epithele typhae]
MSDESTTIAVAVEDGTKTLGRLTTDPAPLKSNPPSPELPTVVAEKPPTSLPHPALDNDAAAPDAGSPKVLVSANDSSLTGLASPQPPSDADAEDDSFATPEARTDALPSPSEGDLSSIPLSPASPSPAPPLATISLTSPTSPAPAPTPPASTTAFPGTRLPPISTTVPPSAGLHSAIFDAGPVSAVTPAPPRKPAGLEALLSPTDPDRKFSTVRGSLASVAETESDAAEDDARFSTVLLSSARESLAVDGDDDEGPRVGAGAGRLATVEEGTGSDENTLVADDWRAKHKKSASTSTILSTNNVPYVMAKLEESAEAAAGSRPASMYSEADQIKEEFYLKQNEEETVDWDFWGLVMNDYQGFASEHPEQLAAAIERGIPKTLRGMIWQLMSASKDPALEQTYLRLLKEQSPHEKAIMRDLGRTFPNHTFFTEGHGIGQENLFNVLKAYSIYDPEVGYCQGLPFIVAILLLNMPDEEAFCLLVRLMHSYDLRGHFLPDMPRLQLRLFQFERLLEEVLPVLHLHFVRQGVKANMYGSQWFLTMFSYRFPMEMVFRIYDKVFANGIEALFNFSISLLNKNEPTLLAMSFDSTVAFLNQRIFDVYEVQLPGLTPNTPASERRYRVDEFVNDAMMLRITPFMLDTYAHEYEELIRARDAHKFELEGLKTANQRLSAQVKTLETTLSQVNTEHCEVLNELVRSRLRHEELESELVRYKLLYAEAMHQSEDALSSHRISIMSNRGSKRGSNSTNG